MDGEGPYRFCQHVRGVLAARRGDANAAKGEIIGWTIHTNLDQLVGDLTTTDGVSLFGVHAGQCCDSFTPIDPIDVISFEWSPVLSGAYEVGYGTDTELMRVWVGDAFGDFDIEDWRAVEADISFQVVPAPPVALTLLVLVGWRRCR